jgi:hypothetical protein
LKFKHIKYNELKYINVKKPHQNNNPEHNPYPYDAAIFKNKS